jgi:hypothetical protein
MQQNKTILIEANQPSHPPNRVLKHLSEATYSSMSYEKVGIFRGGGRDRGWGVFEWERERKKDMRI